MGSCSVVNVATYYVGSINDDSRENHINRSFVNNATKELVDQCELSTSCVIEGHGDMMSAGRPSCLGTAIDVQQSLLPSA